MKLLRAFFLLLLLMPCPLGAAPLGLIDQNAQAVDDEALFKGKPSLLFFGFTHCPDICPTTLQELALVMKALGTDVEKIQVVFASVDPARDTPKRISDYLGNFDKRMIGLTGSPGATAAFAKRWHVHSQKSGSQGGGMVHSASVLLIDKQGQLVSTLDVSDASAAAKKIRASF